MPYQPIEDYGIIGDMRTAALIGKNGSLDWMCYPRFDAPSVFAAILDDEKGGYFQIHPQRDNVKQHQFYWPETNVLVTRFTCSDGVGEIRDFMPIDADDDAHRTRVIRQVVVVRGSLNFDVVCRPAFDYARVNHTIHMDDNGAVFECDGLRMGLSSEMPLEQDEDAVRGSFELSYGQTLTFEWAEVADGCPPPINQDEAQVLFDNTIDYWRKWLAQCTYKGRWRNMVERSALVLKLLTYKPTGAIVAAPTLGLPEDIGGVRNWDYRYVWIRDAAFTLYGFMRIGFTQEAEAFMQWLIERTREGSGELGPLQPLYGINGEHIIEESELGHLKGYKNSQPVRVGNAAYNQLQLDIYGELMDAVYLYNKYGTEVSYDFWQYLRPILDWVCDNWDRQDEGIWEVRGEERDLVYSRLMCWVALDRGLRLADKRSFPAPREKWMKHRDAIYEQVQKNGWSEALQAFKQSYQVETLDAATLIMPLVFFMAPTDPRMLSTLDAIMQHPDEGGLMEDSLVYRYNPHITDDGLAGDEGTFNMCTFWLVEALTRAGTKYPERMEHARLIFDKMLGYANHLGLYSEETGDRDQALGNVPQAFTHLALISSAYNLNRYLRD